MPTNNKEYMKNYMKEYNQKNNYDYECPVCGVIMKKYTMYAHNKTKTHLRILNRLEVLHNPQ